MDTICRACANIGGLRPPTSCAHFPAVTRLISLLLLFAAPLRAELLATFHTTRGNVVAALQYDKAPQTVANFITLAQGTRTRVDPLTGAVIRKPLYVGEKFYRMANNDFTKFAQTGSGTGGANGGPGYTIRDEFHPSLTHVPYVLSMANNGKPHTAGSQIFFTGNISVPEYDNSYTILGLVTDAASRSVIDAIILADANATTINNVTFNRTDPAAVAFNENAQKLPVCSGVAGILQVVPGVSVAYQLAAPQPGGTIFKVHRSVDMQAWSDFGQRYQGTGVSGLSMISFDNGALSRAFYNLSLVTYLDALAPASLANRSLVMGVGSETLTFVFNGQGLGGNLFYSGSAGSSSFSLVSYTPNPYQAQWIMNSSLYGGLKFDCFLDSQNSTLIFGRNTAYQYNVSTWNEIGSGFLSLSK